MSAQLSGHHFVACAEVYERVSSRVLLPIVNLPDHKITCLQSHPMEHRCYAYLRILVGKSMLYRQIVFSEVGNTSKFDYSEGGFEEHVRCLVILIQW